MWENVKFYLLAYVIMVAGVLVSTGLQLLEAQFPMGHPAGILAANLSGITLGGLIMVIGFLRDSRLAQERKHTESERERAESERARADDERERAKSESERAKSESDRAKSESERAALERARADDERERAKSAAEQAVLERARADGERERAKSERERAESERARADHASTELNRLRIEYENATKALIQRLEELNNGSKSPPDAH